MFSPQNVAHEYYPHISAILTDTGSKQNVASGPIPVSHVKFDSPEELVWSCNVLGHTTSYFGEQLTKYTSFSLGYNEPILQLLTGEFGLLCLLKDELKLRNRRGVPIFSYTSSTFKDMFCMAKLPSQLVVFGGVSHNLTEFDLERQRQVRTTELGAKEVGCYLIRHHPKFICCADLEGRITLRNTYNLKEEHSFQTHSGAISDFDVHGNYLVTCGYSARQQPDKCLMVYDLRTCRLITPIVSPIPITSLRFLPAFTSKFCAVCPHSKFQILDAAASPGENMTAFTHVVQTSLEATLISMDVSSSGQALVFGDDYGVIYLHGTNTNVCFNQPSIRTMTEFADPLEPVQPLDPNDNITPLSVINNNYSYKPQEDLISDSLKQHESGRYYSVRKIDKKVLQSVTNRSDVGYTPNPYKQIGRASYIRGTVGVVGVTKVDDEDHNESDYEEGEKKLLEDGGNNNGQVSLVGVVDGKSSKS